MSVVRESKCFLVDSKAERLSTAFGGNTVSEKQRPTPGPWEVGDPDVHGRKVYKYGPAVDDYADPGELAVIAEGMTEPNARLIAAAPEMLAELRECVAALDALIEDRPMLAAKLCGSTTLGNRRAEARSAIAKAEGSR